MKKWTDEYPFNGKSSNVIISVDLWKTIIDEHNRLAELEDKIENGTLIELPCPFGTAIYYLNCNQHDGWWIDVVKFDFRYLSSIGKYAFLTKAEAEQKLKKLQEQDK